MSADKTNVMRILDQKKIKYKVHEYKESGAVSGVEVAAALGQNPKRAFKTLVTVGKSGNHYVFMVPVAEELDLKKAAKCVGEKNIEMIKSKELLPLTGYIHGGCSPVGMKKFFKTVINNSVLDIDDTIFFSAGKIGFQIETMYDELKKLEEETGCVLSNSPTVNVGYEVLSELPKERHDSPMLSLDKTKDREALRDWLGEQKGVLSWKLDGLTIVLTYEDGKLSKAVTRGNGEIGEIITNNARVFKNVPVTIPYKGKLVLRGEAIITYSDFNRINEEIPEMDAKYKNPRNLCSGSVRQLNNKITKERNVNFFAFALVSADNVDFKNSRAYQFEWLKKQGFEVVEYKMVDRDNIIDTIAWFEKTIVNNDFPSDGLVIIYDDIAYGESLGRTAKFPRNAMAFKWTDETADTVLRQIEWSASRTGLINPVAIFDPVELEGTKVSRASVHNISIMEGLKLGIGDNIRVFKANMIIPQIAENLTGTGNAPVPHICPACGQETVIKKENDVECLFCVNPGCPAKNQIFRAFYKQRCHEY